MAVGIALGRVLELPLLFLPLMPAAAVLPAIGRPSVRNALAAGAVAFAGVIVLTWDGMPVSMFGALAGVVAATGLVIASTYRNRNQESSIARLDRLAQVTQAAVLPRPPASIGGVLLDARYLAAAPGATVGGDFCGAEHTPFGARLLIGDVSGKGLDVVSAAAETLHVWRELAHHERTLAGIALRLDAAVARIHSHGFVTAMLVTVHHDGRIELLSCGHPPPLVVRRGRAFLLAGMDPTPPLSLLREAGDQCRSLVIRPGPDDWLLLCTDGVTECRNAAGEFYPLAERLTDFACAEPADALDALESDLARYRDATSRDDAMMLLIRPAPPVDGRAEGPARSADDGRRDARPGRA